MHNVMCILGAWLLIACCSSCVNRIGDNRSAICHDMVFWKDEVSNLQRQQKIKYGKDAKKVFRELFEAIEVPSEKINAILSDPFCSQNYRMVSFVFSTDPQNVIDAAEFFFRKEGWNEIRKKLRGVEDYCVDANLWVRVYQKNGALVRVMIFKQYYVIDDNSLPNGIRATGMAEFSFIGISPYNILGTNYKTLKSTAIRVVDGKVTTFSRP